MEVSDLSDEFEVVEAEKSDIIRVVLPVPSIPHPL